MNGNINIQTQNFNPGNMNSQNQNPGGIPGGIGMPEQPKKSKKGLVVLLIILAIVIVAGVVYYYFGQSLLGPATSEMTGPAAPPEINLPQTPPPASPDEDLNAIDSDLNAIDLNALESDAQTDITDMGGSL